MVEVTGNATNAAAQPDGDRFFAPAWDGTVFKKVGKKSRPVPNGAYRIEGGHDILRHKNAAESD